jgi:hypothetical protein
MVSGALLSIWTEDLKFSSNIANMGASFAVVGGTFLGWGMVGVARHIIPCIIDQGLTLVPSQLNLSRLVTEATASVHFSSQPEMFLPMRPLRKRSRQAGKWTSGVHKQCLR